MQFDFGHAGQAVAARRVLAEAGIGAQPLLDDADGSDPVATAECRLVYRVEVPDADAVRACDVLAACGLPVHTTEGSAEHPFSSPS